MPYTIKPTISSFSIFLLILVTTSSMPNASNADQSATIDDIIKTDSELTQNEADDFYPTEYGEDEYFPKENHESNDVDQPPSATEKRRLRFVKKSDDDQDLYAAIGKRRLRFVKKNTVGDLHSAEKRRLRFTGDYNYNPMSSHTPEARRHSQFTKKDNHANDIILPEKRRLRFIDPHSLRRRSLSESSILADFLQQLEQERPTSTKRSPELSVATQQNTFGKQLRQHLLELELKRFLAEGK